MSKDRIIHLYNDHDLDSPVTLLSHHRTNIQPTGQIKKDRYPWPVDREREQYEKVVVTQRVQGGETSTPKTLWRRIK